MLQHLPCGPPMRTVRSIILHKQQQLLEEGPRKTIQFLIYLSYLTWIMKYHILDLSP
jgi:hypothetical protein